MPGRAVGIAADVFGEERNVLGLRAKLGDDPRNPTWLYTVHGVGYRFDAPEPAAKDEK